MADTAPKSVDVTADREQTSEPVPKKPRCSFLQNCVPGQITSGDVPGRSCAEESSSRPQDTDPEMGVSKATETVQKNNNESEPCELTEDDSNADKTLMSGPESEVLGEKLQTLIVMFGGFNILTSSALP